MGQMKLLNFVIIENGRSITIKTDANKAVNLLYYLLMFFSFF